MKPTAERVHINIRPEVYEIVRRTILHDPLTGKNHRGRLSALVNKLLARYIEENKLADQPDLSSLN